MISLHANKSVQAKIQAAVKEDPKVNVDALARSLMVTKECAGYWVKHFAGKLSDGKESVKVNK